jgi:hypothetical protein
MRRLLKIYFRSGSLNQNSQGTFYFQYGGDAAPIPDEFALLRSALHAIERPYTQRFARGSGQNWHFVRVDRSGIALRIITRKC